MKKVEHVEIDLSIVVEHNDDDTFTAYPEYAENVRYHGKTRAEAVGSVLKETAFMLEDEGEL